MMPPIHVLVVDDEDVVCSNVIAFLEDEGFDVVSASSGEKALDIIASKKFDVGIMDMRLPGIDGNTLILKSHELQPDMKFLIHTGSTNYNLPRALTDIGLSENNIFQKPLIDMGVLVDAIQKLVKGNNI
ncbi:MAG TPA: response regulator [Spirochaetota bacterium]|nr:response regulator [Spirochaetota bacterium]HPQ53095.1 response regulator [Spirochaetota bacterium]